MRRSSKSSVNPNEQHARQNPEKIAVIDTTKQQSFTFVQLLADAAALRKRMPIA
jgi:acyl-CoA synthetase (AMP-forming)/AMP-acid ligase II